MSKWLVKVDLGKRARKRVSSVEGFIAAAIEN